MRRHRHEFYIVHQFSWATTSYMSKIVPGERRLRWILSHKDCNSGRMWFWCRWKNLPSNSTSSKVPRRRLVPGFQHMTSGVLRCKYVDAGNIWKIITQLGSNIHHQFYHFTSLIVTLYWSPTSKFCTQNTTFSGLSKFLIPLWLFYQSFKTQLIKKFIIFTDILPFSYMSS